MQFGTLLVLPRKLFVALLSSFVCAFMHMPHHNKTRPKDSTSVTQSVYRHPVRHKKLPFHIKQQGYNHSSYHCLKHSHSPVYWKTNAKMTNDEQATPTQPSRERCHHDEYCPTELDLEAMSKLELIWTSTKVKSAIPPTHANTNQCGCYISHYPSLVPSFWEYD